MNEDKSIHSQIYAAFILCEFPCWLKRNHQIEMVNNTNQIFQLHLEDVSRRFHRRRRPLRKTIFFPLSTAVAAGNFLTLSDGGWDSLVLTWVMAAESFPWLFEKFSSKNKRNDGVERFRRKFCRMNYGHCVCVIQMLQLKYSYLYEDGGGSLL